MASKYPKYEPIIGKAAKATGLPVSFLEAVIAQESGGNPLAKSKAGAGGMMQLMPGTAKDLGVSNVFDPEQNIMGGAKYLKQNLDKFGSPELALAAYNAGPGNVQKYGNKIPPFNETQSYVQNIMKNVGSLPGFGSSTENQPIAQLAQNGMPGLGDGNLGDGMATDAPTGIFGKQLQGLTTPSPAEQMPATSLVPGAEQPDQDQQKRMLESLMPKKSKLAGILDTAGTFAQGIGSALASLGGDTDLGQKISEGLAQTAAQKRQQEASALERFMAMTKEDKPTSVQEYEYAKSKGGFGGSYDEFLANKKEASPLELMKFQMSMQDRERKLEQEEKGSQLPATQAVMLAEGENIPGMLDSLENVLSTETAKGVSGPIMGKIRRVNPYDPAAQDLEGQIRSVRQVVGKFMEGGMLRAEDEKKYEKMLPSLSDTPEVQKSKMAAVRTMLQKKHNQYLTSFQKSGYDVSQYTPLQAAQAAQQEAESQKQPQGQQPPMVSADEDNEALDWAKKNPNDPRAKQILGGA